MTPRAVLLDVGGVFLLPHPDPVGAALAEAGVGFDPSATPRAHYHGMAANDAGEGAGWDPEAYLGAYTSALGVAAGERERAVDALAPVWTLPVADLWRHLVTDSVVALQKLAAAGVPVAIVSNADGTVEEQLRLQRVCQIGEGVGVPVVAIVDSGVVGVEKPDPAIFDSAVAALDVDPADALYVGDSVRYDVRGAQAAGIPPVHLDPYGLCRQRDDHRHLRSLLELPDQVGA